MGKGDKVRKGQDLNKISKRMSEIKRCKNFNEHEKVVKKNGKTTFVYK